MGVYRLRNTSRIRRLRSRWIPTVVVETSVFETIDNVAISSQLIVEFQSEQEATSGTGSPTITEITSESVVNSATATHAIVDVQSEEEANTGTGSSTIIESISEFVDNSAESSQFLADLTPEADLTNIGSGSQTISEIISEELLNESLNTPNILSAEADAANNSGTGSFDVADATSETQQVVVQSFHDLIEKLQHTYVPTSDISTGSWTVAPLYEKVDELIPAGGYPTESIESGNNPISDTAILGVTASDPGIHTDHYINVTFYKIDTEGGNRIDFTVNLKQGPTLIATRTFEDVQETSDNPRTERISLTEDEADDITNYASLNLELVANEV